MYASRGTVSVQKCAGRQSIGTISKEPEVEHIHDAITQSIAVSGCCIARAFESQASFAFVETSASIAAGGRIIALQVDLRAGEALANSGRRRACSVQLIFAFSVDLGVDFSVDLGVDLSVGRFCGGLLQTSDSPPITKAYGQPPRRRRPDKPCRTDHRETRS